MSLLFTDNSSTESVGTYASTVFIFQFQPPGLQTCFDLSCFFVIHTDSIYCTINVEISFCKSL